MTIFR